MQSMHYAQLDCDPLCTVYSILRPSCNNAEHQHSNTNMLLVTFACSVAALDVKLKRAFLTLYQSIFINGLTSANIDEDTSPLHAANGLCVNELMCCRRKWHCCHDVVTLSHQGVKLVWRINLGTAKAGAALIVSNSL